MAAESRSISDKFQRKLFWGGVVFPKLSEMWRSGFGCDLTICCSDGWLKVPSVLLAALSEQLHKLILSSSDNILKFNNVNVKFWEDLIEWIYSGDVQKQCQVFDNSFLPDFFSTLLVAHTLGMKDMLALYKHTLKLKDQKNVLAEVLKLFDPKGAVDLHIEYNSIATQATLSTTISSKNLNELKDYFSSPECIQDIAVQNSKTFQELCCITCGKNCVAISVQCMLCNQILEKSAGEQHMIQKHKFCPSSVWSFNCNPDEFYERYEIKGHRTGIVSINPPMEDQCIQSFQNNSSLLYECNVCMYSTPIRTHFLDHFLMHGFFPEMCCFCGDVFSGLKNRNRHIEYCGSHIQRLDIDTDKNNTHKEKQQFQSDDELLQLENDASGEETSKFPELPNPIVAIKAESFQKKCILCGDKCSAETVMCLYCNEIVPNDVTHMHQQHEQSKKAEIWAFTCNIQGKGKMEMIVKTCRQENVFHHECRRCCQFFTEKKIVSYHLRSMHRIPAVFYCQHCDCGFRTVTAKNGHEHLCGGGNYIHCEQCSLLFGSVDQFKQHLSLQHKNVTSNKVKCLNDTKGYSLAGEKIKVIAKDATLQSLNTTHTRLNKCAKETVKVERNVLCYSCKKHCIATRVKCMYCYKIVKNDPFHMEEFHPYTPQTSMWVYTCNFLSKTKKTTSEWLLFVKQPSHHTLKETDYKCETCGKICASLTDVICHVKNIHKRKYVKMCDICGSGFGGYIYHKDHFHFCAGGDLVNCTICDKCVGCHKTLLDHMAKTHVGKGRVKSESEIPVGAVKVPLHDVDSVDDYCGDTDSYEEIDEDQQIIDKDWKPLCCNCDKSCSTELVKCMYCFKIVKNDVDHMQESHPFTPKSSCWVYICDYKKEAEDNQVVCVKKHKVKEINFSTGEDEQSGETEVTCNKCNQTFQLVSTVKDHLLKCHKVMAKICDICDSGFLKEIYRKDHHHYCSGGNLLNCAVCGKRMGSYKTLDCHMRQAHPGCSENPSGIRKSTPKKTKHKDKKKITHGDHRIKSFKEESLHKSFLPTLDQMTSSDTEDYDLDNLKIKQIQTENEWQTAACMKENDNVKDTDQISQNEEYEMHNVFIEEKTSQHGVPNAKRCFSCGDNCSRDLVKCMFCNQVVSGSDMTHMAKSHPSMPNYVIWAVNCSYFDVETTSPVIAELCRIENDEVGANPNYYHCKICEEYYRTTAELTVHTRKDHKFSVCFCKICNAGFKYPAKRRSHQQFCSGGDLLKCILCEKLIGNWINANSHFYGFHKQKRSPESKRRRSIKRVVKTVDGSENYSFDEDGGDVFIEMQRTRGTVPMKVCLLCDDKCSSFIVKCVYCGRVVDGDTEEHMKEVHPFTPSTSIWPVKCKMLPKESVPYLVASRVNLQGQAHDGSNEGSDIENVLYKCEMCEKLLQGQSLISEHLESTHNIKCHFCKQCGLSMRTKHFKLEHQHYCTGHDVVKCIPCKISIGGWHNSSNHRSTYHPQIETPGKRRKVMAKNFTLLDELQKSAAGKYGYQLLCADCMGPCPAAMVKCGLCNEIVQADDIHMKLKHPYCPQSTWIVFCRCAVGASANHLVDIIGDKVPKASLEDVLRETSIPSLLPHNYKCNQCDVVTEDQLMMTNHIKFAHLAGDSLFICKTCGAMIGKKRDLQLNHAHFCSQGTVYKCNVCGELHGTRKKLMYHTLINHRKETKSEKLQSMSTGKDEVKIPEGVELQCADCDFKTPLLSKLRKHNKTVHSYKICQLYQICRFCFKVFKWCSLREQHEQAEHLGGQKILCEICGKDFSTPLQQERHIKYFHKGGREISSIAHKYKEKKICPHCGNAYKTTAALNKHIKVVHEQQLDYYCKICNKGFSCRANLKVHEDRHNGVKKFSCPYCLYKAYRGNIINEHVLKHHPGRDKPYKRNSVFSHHSNWLCETGDETMQSNSQLLQESSQVPQEPIEDFVAGEFINQILFQSSI